MSCLLSVLKKFSLNILQFRANSILHFLSFFLLSSITSVFCRYRIIPYYLSFDTSTFFRKTKVFEIEMSKKFEKFRIPKYFFCQLSNSNLGSNISISKAVLLFNNEILSIHYIVKILFVIEIRHWYLLYYYNYLKLC